MTEPGDRDEAWFTHVYATHHAAVTRYGLRRLRSAEAAGELAQEVFVVVWRRRLDVPDHAILTEEDQEILRLVGWEELTVAEAAAVVGSSRATAAVRLHRARRKLRAAMTAYDNPATRRAAVLL
jgi:DNA-directed RNA polymerase specialized sigma24 family protein